MPVAGLTITCGKCGKKLSVNPEKGDRNVKCPGCGQAIMVRIPTVKAPGLESDEYDLADEPAPPPTPKPKVGGSPVSAEDVLAHLRHLETPGGPFQEAHTQVLLQAGDTAAELRLRGVERAGRRGEPTMGDHGDEQIEVVEVLHDELSGGLGRG